MKKFQLFFFPYAGGSIAAYHRWRPYLDRRIDIKLPELSGRGKRIYDPLYETLEDAVDDIFKLIKDDLYSLPYAFYGHSMGSLIAFELANKIRNHNLPEPQHIFFSGRGAPHVPYEDDEKHYLLPDEAFKNKIIEMGGTPKEFFEHPELLAVLLPMIRSDFKIAETYEFKGTLKPFNNDITVFLGKDEKINADEVYGWREVTSKLCTLHFFEGGHFFINDYSEQIVTFINHTLFHPSKESKPYPIGF